MTLITNPEVPSKLIRSQFILAVLVLVIKNGMTADFEDVEEIKAATPGNESPTLMTSYDGFHRVVKRSSFFDRVKKFYKFPSTPTKTEITSPKFTIPAEGGIVHITRPTAFRRRRARENTAVIGKITGTVTEHSIKIPDEGGSVHIDEPDYVKLGRTTRRSSMTTQNVLSTTLRPRKDSRNVSVHSSGKANAVSGERHANVNPAKPSLGNATKLQFGNDSGDLGEIPGGNSDVAGNWSVRSETVTQVVLKEDSSMNTQAPVTNLYIGGSNYPFFAAIHSKGYGNVSFDNVVCSGGIVSSTRVVTSCSCLYGGGWPAPPVPESYAVSVGHRKFASIDNLATYEVKTINYHPSCFKADMGLWQGNIAILYITEPGLKFSSEVQPMKLPKLKMWDASDVLAKMSDERRHCRVIGWSSEAPLIDTAIGKLIPLSECASPTCSKHLGCPVRNAMDGFMVEITPNEPSLKSGALLYCSEHVFAVVNTKRECATNNVFATCSPEELLYSLYDFELTPDAQKDLRRANGSIFLNTIHGWDTYTYPPEISTTTTTSTTATQIIEVKEVFVRVGSSSSIFIPFYLAHEASSIYTCIFAVGYYSFIFN